MKIQLPFGPSHTWGDDWPHWKELYEAERFISTFVHKRSGCTLRSKEKYGTLRYEDVVPPHWTWHIFDFKLYFLWRRFGYWILKKAINRAVKKFPNCKQEILDDFEE